MPNVLCHSSELQLHLTVMCSSDKDTLKLPEVLFQFSKAVIRRKSRCACAYLLSTKDIEDCHIIDHVLSTVIRARLQASTHPERLMGLNSLQLVPLGWYTPTVL
ncbi:hypothetical protein Q7C36_015095 [Tachysurus vachellii]|uniref:Uncharacterized protein n=1 Tax=Tachysurus vachellii TaxID=175792 RepID=A0AA88MFB4_TACVA|nr:hypothetical protein Q7C36_015095 [Tachysurus vachellii]